MIGVRRWLLMTPVLVVAAYAMFADATWVGSWAGTVDRINGSTVLTGPLLASIAAGTQLGAARARQISDASPRGGQVPLRSAWEAWLIGTAAHVLAGVAALMSTAAVPHGGPLQWWALAAGPLVLALTALLGAVAVRLLPSRPTALAVGPVVFLLGAFAPPPGPEVLRFGPVGSMTGLEFSAPVLGARGLAIAGICAGLSLVVMRLQPRGVDRTRAGVVTAGGILVGLVPVAAVILGPGGDHLLVLSSERSEACAGAKPTICVMPSHRRHLAGIRDSVARPAQVLREAGVVLPERYVEDSRYRGTAEEGGVFDLDEGRPIPTARDAVLALARPADCPQWASDDGPPFVAWDVERLIAEWVVARSGGEPHAFSPEMQRWLPHLDDEATTAWVVATFELLKACELERLTLPWE